jgi:hypothetical protein
MKDIKFLSECNVPVLCIWKGQIPTKTLQNVILHNFLPNTVLGFVVTEKVTGIEPIEPEVTGIKDQGYFADDQRSPKELSDYVDSLSQNPKPLLKGCLTQHGNCADCPDFPGGDCLGGVDFKDGVEVEDLEVEVIDDEENVPCRECGRTDLPLHWDRTCPECFFIPDAGEVEVDDDRPHDCLDCRHGALSCCDEPCDGCYDQNEWVTRDKAGLPDDSGVPESLYKAGCWVSLENRKHDLMSEWSLAAPDCKFQFEAEERDELLCSHDDHSLFPCHFDDCPRMRA